VSDAFLFAAMSRVCTPSSIFIIGNAFGCATFILADLFPAAQIDVIDANCEGADNSTGSDLTRRIAAADFPNVQLTTGYSPQDVSKATRSEKYQFVFIDGLHTNEQMFADFEGIRALLDTTAVVLFHDVASHRMFSAWQKVLAVAEPDGFKGYQLCFTQFGVCALSRGSQAVDEYLSSIASKFGDVRYHLGVPPRPKRPIFWIKSAYEVELFLRHKLAGLFRR
jgi:Methyltransferase domain